MKLNTGFAQPLQKECERAAKIFKSFVDSGNNGLDGVVPRGVLENAKGFAILTVFKAGFLFSARAGSGVVIAKLDDGTWSAPSAIGTAGLGVGGQAGAEMTDFLIVLNTRSAIKSFMSAGSLTLGGNMSIAVGPLGRNGEAIGSLSTGGRVSAMYSYSKTKGLFGGVSIEGSVIVERQDANVLAYQSDVNVKMLLSGAIPPPDWAQPLIKTLELCTGLPGNRKWIHDEGMAQGGLYSFGGLESPKGDRAPSGSFSPFGKKKKTMSSPGPFPPPSWGRKKSGGSYFTSDFHNESDTSLHSGDLNGGSPEPTFRSKSKPEPDVTANFETHFDSDFLQEGTIRKHPHLTVSPDHTSVDGSYQSGSPFNSLPPFDVARSRVSSPATHTPSYSLDTGLRQKAASNPFGTINNSYTPPSQSRSDPFSLSSKFSTGYNGSTSSLLSDDLNAPPPTHKPIRPLQVKPGLDAPLQEGVGRAVALYDFDAVQYGDLSFKNGDVITILEKSNSSNAWWKGKVKGREGIFPANRVELV